MTLSSWMPRTVRRIYLHRIVIGTDKSQMKVSSEDVDLIYPVKTTVNNVIDILMRIDEYLLLEEVWPRNFDRTMETRLQPGGDRIRLSFLFSICQACQSRVSRRCNYLPKDIVKSPILDDFSEHDLLVSLVSIGWKSGSSARKRLLQNRRIAYVVWNILYGYALIQSLSPLVGVRRKWHRFTTRYNFRSEVCNMAYIHQKGLINIQIFRDDQPVTYLHPSVAKWDD